MPDLSNLTRRAREMQYQGHSESNIKEYLHKQDLNDYQVNSILATLKPSKVAGKEEDYIQLRYGIKLRRWQIVIAMRFVAFFLGAVIIVGVIFASIQTGKSIGDSILLLVFAGAMILFSSGLIDRWL